PNPVGDDKDSTGKDRTVDPIDVKIKPIVDKNGCSVEITHKTVSIYDPTGKLLQIESVVDYTKENVLGQYATLDLFIEEWRNDPKKDKI
ncbi:Type I restriction-modification system, R subunit, partial [human gut metagenome]